MFSLKNPAWQFVADLPLSDKEWEFLLLPWGIVAVNPDHPALFIEDGKIVDWDVPLEDVERLKKEYDFPDCGSLTK